MSEIKKHIQLMEARGVLGAENGGLDLYINDETIPLGKTPEEVASKLKDIKDLDLDDLYASSSVDFADEYGFANEDDAHELFDKAVALMIPKPDENRAKVEDEPITSELLAKLNAEESVEEGCDVCDGDEPEKSEEQHQYSKQHSTSTGSVSVEASAETVDELKVLLQKVGITLPSGEPEVGHDMDHSPCDDSEEPMQIVKVDVDDEKPQVNPYNSGQPDKQVLTNIIRDKLKDYLRNSQS